MRINNTDILVIKGDITDFDTDAIVNAANNKLIMGGGVAGAIRKKAGKAVEEEALRKGPIEIGEAIETTAGFLPAKYIIHAATMGMDFHTDEEKIRNACANTLKLAKKLKLKSIAFPALGCGTGGFPLVAAAKIMAQEVLKHVKYDNTTLQKILFVLFDNQAFEVFKKEAIGYLVYIEKKQSKGPFSTADVIIELKNNIVLIERSNPPFGWALPGGFLDYGESLEDCARREAKEETGLDIRDLRQFHTYSSPNRDPRFHTVTTVFIAKAEGVPQASSDAKGVKVVGIEEALKMKLAFDHAKILEDYKKSR